MIDYSKEITVMPEQKKEYEKTYMVNGKKITLHAEYYLHSWFRGGGLRIDIFKEGYNFAGEEFWLMPGRFLLDIETDRYYFFDIRISELYEDILNDFLKQFSYLPSCIECEHVERIKFYRTEKYIAEKFDYIPVFKTRPCENFYFTFGSPGSDFRIFNIPEKNICYYYHYSIEGIFLFHLDEIFREDNRIAPDSYIMCYIDNSKDKTFLQYLNSATNFVIDFSDISLDENMLYTVKLPEDRKFTDALKKYLHNYIQKYILEG